MSVPSYKDRLLEIHGINIWNTFYVDRAIRFVKSYNLTGIIFHCNEPIDKAVFPDKYFDKNELLSFNPVRNSVTKNYRYYLRSVLDKCRENGLELYGEVKEIYFHNDLITKYPQSREGDGALCATDPFWWEFLKGKYREFFAVFPDVAGIIVNPGTRESMVSFAANRCTCQHCRDYDVGEWYRDLLAVMHRAIGGAGKKLIVRDFSYTKAHWYAIVDAAGSVSDSITMSMKKVPHDYYPVLSDNPAIGSCGKLNQWVEFGTWGQFFGLGVLPCGVSGDMKGRMQQYLNKGATGIMLRTDWGNMTQSSVFCGFNMLNLIAGAMISFDMNTDIDAVYDTWLDHGLVFPLIPDSYSQIPCKITEGEDRELSREMVQLRRKILERGIHVRGHVFNRNCQIFDRYDLIYNITTVFHNQDQWEPNASKRAEPTGENIPVMIAEKDEASAMARKPKDMIAAASPDVNHNVKTYLEFVAEGFLAYTKGLHLELTSTAYTKKVEISQDPGGVQEARETLAGYEELVSRYDSLVGNKGYSHVVEYMLDGDRLICSKADTSRVLGAIWQRQTAGKGGKSWIK